MLSNRSTKEEKMKKAMLKSVLLVGAVMFLVSFVSVAVASEEAEVTRIINGSIVGISADTGQIEVKDESGQVVNLKAGSEIDLGSFSKGEVVTIQASDKGIITNMSKEAMEHKEH
jgi:hypothetical protein